MKIDIRHIIALAIAIALIWAIVAGLMADVPSGQYDSTVIPDVNADDSGMFIDGRIFEDGSYYLDVNLSLNTGANGCLPIHMWNGRPVIGACLD